MNQEIKAVDSNATDEQSSEFTKAIAFILDYRETKPDLNGHYIPNSVLAQMIVDYTAQKEQPSPQSISNEQIELLAEKEYPYDKNVYELTIRSDEKTDFARSCFIDGYKAKI